jgi:glycosyltransferase involved in cell wall biosynthesis
MTTRVHAWLADTAGCGYYRGILPHRILDTLDGWATTAATQLPEEPDTLDIIWSQRITRPEPSETVRRIIDYGPGRPLLVIDCDDALDLIPTSSLTAHAFYRGPTADGELERWATNLRHADIVTASTVALAHHLTELLGIAEVLVVPNFIDARAADEPLHPILGHPFPFTIGYQGSDTHYEDVGPLDYALRQLHKRHPDIGLQLIGHNWTVPLARRSDPTWGRGDFPLGRLPAVWSWPADRLAHTSWFADIVELYQVVKGFDVGLAPLVDSPFNRAKSPIKLLEYSLLGVPWVASPVGPYLQWVEDVTDTGNPEDAGGLFASSPDDWLHALETLYANPDLRRDLAAASAPIAQLHTAQANADLLPLIYTHTTPRTTT